MVEPKAGREIKLATVADWSNRLRLNSNPAWPGPHHRFLNQGPLVYDSEAADATRIFYGRPNPSCEEAEKENTHTNERKHFPRTFPVI